MIKTHAEAERVMKRERTNFKERPLWLTQYLNKMVTKPKHCKQVQLERAIELITEIYETKHRKRSQ